MKYNNYEKFSLIYDRVYKNEKFYTAYVALVKKTLKEKNLKSIRVLDVACGTGRLIKQLIKIKNFYVEGVDSSMAMLKIARSRNKGIKFYNQNIINFFTGQKYDIILCTFDSINYIKDKLDLSKALKSINNHLLDNGLFIFDFNTNHKRLKERIVKGNVVYNSRIKRGYWDLEILINEKGVVHKEHHQERLYSYKEMTSALMKNGFKIIELYSGFNKRINNPGKSQRLIIVSQKTK